MQIGSNLFFADKCISFFQLGSALVTILVVNNGVWNLFHFGPYKNHFKLWRQRHISRLDVVETFFEAVKDGSLGSWLGRLSSSKNNDADVPQPFNNGQFWHPYGTL